MADRYYKRVLECGCMYSSDGGGGLIPCCDDDSDPKQVKKCMKAHAKWHKSKDYKLYLKEIKEKNR